MNNEDENDTEIGRKRSCILTQHLQFDEQNQQRHLKPKILNLLLIFNNNLFRKGKEKMK